MSTNVRNVLGAFSALTLLVGQPVKN